MTHYEQAAAETEDRFYAQFDSRDVKLMTLDELQAAFEEGLIHERTYVCREGEGEWLTLAVVAGMGDEEEEPEPEQESGPTMTIERRPPIPQRALPFSETLPLATPASVETRPPAPRRASTPPSAADVPQFQQSQSLSATLAPQSSGTRPPMPQRAADLGAGRPAMAPPRTEALPQLNAARPELNTIPATWQASPFPATSLAAFDPKSPQSYGPVTTSTVPGVDLDDLAFRPKRRTGRIVGAIAALGVVGGAAAFALTGGLHSFAGPSFAANDSASKSAASLANIDKPSAPAAAPEVPSTPEPVAAATTAPAATDAPAAASAAPEFTSDMKQALLNADKERKVKQKTKVKGRAAPSSVAHHAHAASPGFSSGGSAYDPLNGKL